MALCGWKTRAMFDRYNVTSADDLSEGVGRLNTFLTRRTRSQRRPQKAGKQTA